MISIVMRRSRALSYGDFAQSPYPREEGLPQGRTLFSRLREASV